MYRHPKVQKKYDREKGQKEGCVFCNLETEHIVEEYDMFFIIKNIYPYYLWDLKEVEDHFLVVPKKHAQGFEHLEDDHMSEYTKIITIYSSNGYDTFTRTSKSSRKTQPHLHTHLIKTKGDIKKKLTFTEKPYKLEYE